MITKKLKYYPFENKEKIVLHRTYFRIKNCISCGKEITIGIVVESFDEKILDIFNIDKLARGSCHYLYFCNDCFDEIHPKLEEIESEGWYVLEDEYPNDDLSGENGSGKPELERVDELPEEE